MSNVSKTDFVNSVVAALDVRTDAVAPKKVVEAVMKAIASVSTAALKKGDVVTIPGLVRLKAVKKPATKERDGINPFTKEKVRIPAKPASTKVKASALKPLRDAVA
jgi:nucleoid DNA-binding protein